jgi:hypothetical protein
MTENGSKTRVRISIGTPGPVSPIPTISRAPSARVRTATKKSGREPNSTIHVTFRMHPPAAPDTN